MGTLGLHTGCPESRLGAQTLLEPLGGLGVRGRPSPQAGMEQKTSPRATHRGHQLLWSLGSLTWLDLDGRSEVVLPEAEAWGEPGGPAAGGPRAPQLQVHLKAPLSFLLCKSPTPDFLFPVPGCNGTCCYVILYKQSTFPMTLRSSQGWGEVVLILLLPGENHIQSSQSWSPRYSWGQGAHHTSMGRFIK